MNNTVTALFINMNEPVRSVEDIYFLLRKGSSNIKLIIDRIYDDYYEGNLFDEEIDRYHCEELSCLLGYDSIKMHLLLCAAITKEDIDLMTYLVELLGKVDKKDEISCGYLRELLGRSSILDLGYFLTNIIDIIIDAAIHLKSWSICDSIPNPLFISCFRGYVRIRNMDRLITIIKQGSADFVTGLYIKGYPFHRLKSLTRLLLRRAFDYNQFEIFKLLIQYGNLKCTDINTCNFYMLRNFNKHKNWKFMNFLLIKCPECLPKYTEYSAKMGYEDLLWYFVSQGGHVNASSLHPDIKHMSHLCIKESMTIKSARSAIK